MQRKCNNVFEYAALRQAAFTRLMGDYGYTTKTTFYQDLSIAEWCDGARGVRKTYADVVKHWLNDYRYFTEFVMALNHKIWEHYDGDLPEDAQCNSLAACYNDLWQQADELALDTFTGEAKSYYLQTTD